MNKSSENRKSHKKSKRPHGAKPGKLHGKSKKPQFKRGKDVMSKSKNKKHKTPQYVPEVGARPPIEIQFAQKLAANEPTIRDKAVKKLKKWLISRSDVSGDENSTSPFNDHEMLRLWKGLHYCFWMSDKPLVQEELAEKIASIIHCFKADEESAQLYLRCFLLTLGREWAGIDRHRMDKFMMLTRRMIRQAFVYVAAKNWNAEFTKKVATIFEEVVLSANRLQNSNTTALGFQLHFTDVYLEELAKAAKNADSISKEKFTDETILRLLQPYVNELALGDEERLLNQIENRIFDYLIRQSDVAIAYEEDDEDSDIVNGKLNSDEDAGVVLEKESENEFIGEEFVIDEADPRAGRGDVTLPQIQMDYQKLAKKLLDTGGKKEVSKSQRERLYRITKKFNHLVSGIYPFALEMTDDGERMMDEKEFEDEERSAKLKVGKAAKRKAKEEIENAILSHEDKMAYRLAIKKRIKREKANDNEQQDCSTEVKDSEPKSDTATLENANTLNNGVEKILKTGKNDNKKKNKEKHKSVQSGHTNEKTVSPLGEQNQADRSIERKRLKHKAKESVQEKTKSGKSVPSPAMIKPYTEIIPPNNALTPSSKPNKSKKKKKSTLKSVNENIDLSESKLGLPPTERETTEKDGIISTEITGQIRGNECSNESIKKKLFKEADDWDEPLQEGETEVSPNPKLISDGNLSPTSNVTPTSITKKKKKKSDKIKSTKDDDIYGTPVIKTSGTLHKPIFLKKALSKSGIGSNKKKHLKEAVFAKGTQSEPPNSKGFNRMQMKKDKMNRASKRINFAMTENKCQSLKQIDVSIQQSPNFQPFDATKRPAKGPILKTPPSSGNNAKPKVSSNKRMLNQTVMYNTMVNGKSKFASRPVASDFF